MASDVGAAPSQVIRGQPNMDGGHRDKIVKSTRSIQSSSGNQWDRNLEKHKL